MVNLSPQQARGETDFPGKDPAEEFRFYFRKHWFHPARSFLQLLLWMLIFAVVAYMSGVFTMDDEYTRRLFSIPIALLFVAPHLLFMMKLYRHFLCVSIVTDKKVHYFKRTLVTEDVHSSVDLWVLQDIDKMQRGLFQNMFGFGSLRLEAQNSTVKIHFVPKIDKVYKAIVSLRELARSKTHPRQQERELERETAQEVAEVQS